MRFKWLLTFALVAGSCGVLYLAFFMAASALPVQDFSDFWAAAKLMSKNPYSHALVAALEKAHGLPPSSPWLVIKNPPWAILFVLPFGLFEYRTALALWNTLSIIILVICSRVVWNLITTEESMAPLLLPLLFGPTAVLVMLGQWTILVLAGVTLFLWAVEKNRDWIAGAALMLVLGKFHIALLFLLAVALWSFHEKRKAILLSATLTTGLASLTSLAINPHIFSQFLAHGLDATRQTSPFSNLGGILYAISGVQLLALLPQVAGVLWLLFYWFRNRSEWNWSSHGMLVLTVSLTCCYYSYPYDEIILLPALVIAFVTGNRNRFITLFVAANIGYALYIFNIAGKFGFNYMFLWWTATAWLITYLASRPNPQLQTKREFISA